MKKARSISEEFPIDIRDSESDHVKEKSKDKEEKEEGRLTFKFSVISMVNHRDLFQRKL